MNYQIYNLYCEHRRMINLAEARGNKCSDEELNILADRKLNQIIMDEKYPEYLDRYTLEQNIVNSFSVEQRDFICAQIGWWYLVCKDTMREEDKYNQHWLNVAKEELKIMICGD